MNLLGPQVRVSVEFVDRIPRTLAGKFVRALPLGGREAQPS